MLSYRIINLYIERYLHYTLDYYINHEYNIYIQILFSFGIPKDKFQVTSLLRFCSHNLSFLIITLKIYLESSQVIWILIWIFFCLYSDPPRLEILGLSLNWKKIKIYEGGHKYVDMSQNLGIVFNFPKSDISLSFHHLLSFNCKQF